MTTSPLIEEGLPLLTRAGGVATLTLRRPSQRNSLTDDDLLALLAHFESLNADPSVRVLVLTADTRGQGRPVFSAGYNVAGFNKDPESPQFFERVADALEKARPITVCALNGSVYGGATDLVLACDLRVALRGMEWRMPACALGLHYYPSGLRRYLSRLGLNLSKRAFLLGQSLPYESLDKAELFESLCEAAEFEWAVQALTTRLLEMAPLALQATKQSLNELAAGEADLQALRARGTLTSQSADFAEGRAAFAERRSPFFQGR